jgi:hypothetical protein
MALARSLALLASSFLIIELLGCTADISTIYHVALAVRWAHNLQERLFAIILLRE